MSEERGAPTVYFIREGNGALLRATGDFTLDNAPRYQTKGSAGKVTSLNGEAVQRLDTTGASYLLHLYEQQGGGTPARLVGFRAEHESLLRLVEEAMRKFGPPPARVKKLSLIGEIGRSAVTLFEICRDTVTFIGELAMGFWELICSPRLFRPKETAVQLEATAVHAIPIICLVTFLIGIVVSYLFAIQIEKYGASIFIVDSLALAMTREMSPILVSTVMAGRSGSAFTAQIGSMKINEEIDALITMGLSPMHILVIPRVIALVCAMPLLVFIGDIIGILGGMIVGHFYLEIPADAFIDRLQRVLPVRIFLTGLIKAPVFALFIALIGCRLGLSVENNARSLGLATTSTVVQSIVCLILLNATFAILFVELGL